MNILAKLQDQCPLEKYSARIFTDAVKILEKYNKNGIEEEVMIKAHFFCTLPMQSVSMHHLEAPQDYIDSFNKSVSNPKRRILPQW